MSNKTYRESRNIEASLLYKIDELLAENHYTNVTVTLQFKKVYTLPFDENQKTACIHVGLEDTEHKFIEVGSYLTHRLPLIIINIFATSDSQRLDLKDLLISELKSGFDYYICTISGGSTSDAVLSGRDKNGKINVLAVTDSPVDFGIDKSNLEIHDRYRHQITLECAKSTVEE